jgi:hypothetical protein
VAEEAQQQGLCRPRWSGAPLLLLWVSAALTIGCAWLANEEAERTTEVGALEALALAGFASGLGTGGLAAALGSSERQRDTDAGLAVAGHWLGVRRYLADQGDFATKPAAAVAMWDRYLAHAAALDLAPVAVAQLPLGAEDDRHAWSRVTGQWRHVEAVYPRLWPGYGQHPLVAVATGVAVGWAAALVARTAWTSAGGGLGPVRALSAAAVIALIWSGVKVVGGLVDLVAVETVEGTVLRARERRWGAAWGPDPIAALRATAGERRRSYHVAIDAGTADRVDAWRVSLDLYRRAPQGTRVRARVTKVLRHVRSLERSAG